MKSRSGVIQWSLRGIYLFGWAAVGIFVWMLRMLGSAALSSVARGRSSLGMSRSRSTVSHSNSPAEFYRSFVAAVDSVGSPRDGG